MPDKFYDPGRVLTIRELRYSLEQLEKQDRKVGLATYEDDCSVLGWHVDGDRLILDYEEHGLMTAWTK